MCFNGELSTWSDNLEFCFFVFSLYRKLYPPVCSTVPASLQVRGLRLRDCNKGSGRAKRRVIFLYWENGMLRHTFGTLESCNEFLCTYLEVLTLKYDFLKYENTVFKNMTFKQYEYEFPKYDWPKAKYAYDCTQALVRNLCVRYSDPNCTSHCN